MHFEGSVQISASREKVWAFLIDPNQVGSCGPGVESIEVIDETHFKATAKVGVGFISARFVVNMELVDLEPPDQANIKAHGQAPGSAVDATAVMRLSDGEGGGTTMDWEADVNISGTLASVGARLIEGTANKMIGQTFDCIRTSSRPDPRVTYSIVARDPETGDLGVAVQSKFLAVGAVVPWARAGVGAIATQAFANVGYGPDGLALLADGHRADEVLQRLAAADDRREHRQVGVVDARGRAATHTGIDCLAWAGGRIGENFAAQGNILADATVVDGLADTFLAGGQPFPELLVACLAAAEAAGGDRRGSESAALLIVRDGGGFGGGNDRWVDLRVDQHDDPVGELGRVLGSSASTTTTRNPGPGPARRGDGNRDPRDA